MELFCTATIWECKNPTLTLKQIRLQRKEMEGREFSVQLSHMQCSIINSAASLGTEVTLKIAALPPITSMVHLQGKEWG